MRHTLLILALVLSGCTLLRPKCEPVVGTSESDDVDYWEEELMIVGYEE